MEQQANSGLLKHKWENAFTLDTTTWGYKRNSDITECALSLAACSLSYHTGNVHAIMKEMREQK